MKFLDEYRDGSLARRVLEAIRAEVRNGGTYRFMEFCGGHTHAIARYGLQRLLPPNIVLIHGPGCPVCVLPVGRLDSAIHLARLPGVTLCSYGDMLRVPASGRRSLLSAKSEGAHVKIVYSALDAVRLAQAEPARHVVFFAIGFETTTPPTAAAIRFASVLKLENFSVYCNHVLTPSAIAHILEAPAIRGMGRVELDGFIGPAHVSTVIGYQPYEYFAEEYQRPVVVAGFEPLDLLEGLLMLVRQVNDGRFEVENQYHRAVHRFGNRYAQTLVAECFELRKSFEWRGLGALPYSALRVKDAFCAFDAERRFEVPDVSVPDHPACDCGAILRGVLQPTDCRLFGRACTPDHPIGPCMVSREGACSAVWSWGCHEAKGDVEMI